MGSSRPIRVRRPMSVFSKIILVILGIFAVIMTTLGIMARCGLMLIDTSLYLWLLVGMLLTLVAWGVGTLIRRFKRMAAKIAAVVASFMVIMMLLLIGAQYVAPFLTYMPNRYSTAVSESGTPIVIFRGYYYDQERVNSRHPTEDGTDAEPQSLDDYSYVFSAFPQRLSIFYFANAEVEGQVIIGVDSQATLMLDWPDPDTARLYIDNPQTFDSGECVVKLK